MSLSMKPGLASLVSLVVVLALAPAAPAQDPVPGDQEAPEEPLFETIERPLADGSTLTADHYRTRHVTPGPVIVAFHMEGSSRAEFRDIAKTFLDYNGSVLAVDLRAGKEAKGVANATAAAFEAKHQRPATPAEAYADVVEAVAWARELHEGAKVVLLGSGYSASLALVYAAREPEGCDAVIAFSPGELIEGWTVAAEVRGVKVPVYVSCGNGIEEKSRTTRVSNALDKKLRASFYPPDGLVAPRGALQLEQSDVNAHRRVWNGVYAILKPLAPAAPAAPAGG
jgi:pimeloyl-ACP methyl ester carboxylesterase